ncbi:MAG: type II toxin-antitoxin system HipA family toxin [Acidimicrobiia bacterium]|nr:type II toxin-antitoxin system HipA family toxin [Acidimicrobiia bacterium]
MTSDWERRPAEAFVWLWLPDAARPVPAGRLVDHDGIVAFAYGRSYLARPDRLALYAPELPLRAGAIMPARGEIAGCIADAGPDAWGRRVIERRRMVEPGGFSLLGYLLESASDRIGALDIQRSADSYEPRAGDTASIEELAAATERVERGEALPEPLQRTLLHGTSAGGARPKMLLSDGDRRWLAKFPSVTDSAPITQAEHVAMDLAAAAGLDAPAVELRRAAGKPVLLVERFDRTAGGGRRMMVSGLTILGLHDADGIAGRYGTYPALATQIRHRFAEPKRTLRELFARIAFNVLVGNTDDHPRNHAAFWDGATLSLTPVYDVCPQPRVGQEAQQAMAYGPSGERLSQVSGCLDHASTYHLPRSEATGIIDHQIDVIRNEWHVACDRAQLTVAERSQRWGSEFLNPFALYGYRRHAHLAPKRLS